jgi:hypothetical protein
MIWENFTKIDLEALSAPNVFQKGVSYHQQGHLLKACKVGDTLAGVLAGTSGSYKARLWFEADGLHWECACPYPDFCKHLVALALGWLEKDIQFHDLGPQLTMVTQNLTELPDITRRLVHQDPLNFLELYPSNKPETDFPTNRGIINLIRNTFAEPYLTKVKVEALWENLKQVEEIIFDRLQSGDPEALLPLRELLLGLTGAYQIFPGEVLNNYINNLLLLVRELPARFTKESLTPVFETLLESYLDPGLWGLAVLFRPVIGHFGQYDRDFLSDYIEDQIAGPADNLTLIALYELLIENTAGDPPDLKLAKIKSALDSTVDGRLWLLDRFMETDPEQAFKIAKTGFRAGDYHLKRAFRDRLIILHQRRNEAKQAASLSFIQFQEEPNFEEYLRLKVLLANHPSDWTDYLKRLKTFLTERGHQILLIRIAIDCRDYQGTIGYLDQVAPDSHLLSETVELFSEGCPPEFIGVYPHLVEILLQNGVSDSLKSALKITIAFKKECLRSDQKEAWNSFRLHLMEEYQDNPFFKRKFGTILEVQ